MSIRISSNKSRFSGFLLSLLSPIFQRAICGPFRESSSRSIQLDEVDRTDFEMLVDLAMGRIGLAANTEILQVVRLASLADRFQMEEVGAFLEEAAIRRLRISACSDVLVAIVGTEPGPICSAGLPRLRAAALALAAQRFEEVASTEGFIRLREDEVDALLQDQTMKAGRAEVMQAIVPWMRAAIDEGGGEFPGRRLLARIHLRTFRSMHQQRVFTECMLALKDPEGDEQPEARAWTCGVWLRRMGIWPNGGVGRFLTQFFS